MAAYKISLKENQLQKLNRENDIIKLVEFIWRYLNSFQR